ncbi:MAG: hypothetical protein U5L09_05815 [Bacteroidales bacterium]|nr:hypothetical protein [Bacteroidales bacterium]
MAGFRAGKKSGYAISTANEKPEPVAAFRAHISATSRIFCWILEEAKAMIEAEDSELVSIRSWHEIMGK